MKAIRSLAILAALAVTLSACGLVNSFIEDQDVDNPLGIDGTPVSMTAEAAPTSQALALTVTGDIAASFADIDVSQVPAGIQPHTLLVSLALQSTATLTSADGVLPDTINVTAAALDLTVKDGSGAPTSGVLAEGSGSLLRLTKRDPACAAAVGCAYSVVPAVDQDTLLEIEIKDAAFIQLWGLATGGSETNTVTGTFSLTLEPALPTDVVVSVTISAPNGVFQF